MKNIFTVSLVLLIVAQLGSLCGETTPNLQQALNQQRQLIARVDTQGLFNKISSCYQQIGSLESKAGVSWRKPHAETLSLLCGTCNHQKSALAAQLQQLDKQRTIDSATRCKLHRLYTQAASYGIQLATLLEPYKQELRVISDRVHQLKMVAKQDYAGKYGMLFL